MILTDEQKAAVRHPGNVALVACPGSGKTRTLVAKLASCIEEVRGSSRKIACITYTNTAALEVEKRLKLLSIHDYEDYCDISTIHAFCLSNIMHFFSWMLPEYGEGYEVLPPDSDQYKKLAKEICEKHSIPLSDLQYFESLNREPDGTPVVAGQITPKAALEFWELLESEGYIDFSNIVYKSFQLIKLFPALIQALACKYKWFLVDEFQDTSALQVEILTAIAEKNLSNFFIVGDPYQSIYGFAGAKPELFDTFTDRVSATRDFKLLENWRSSPPIIQEAEALCQRNPPMVAVGTAKDYTENPLCVHASTAFQAITDYFLPTVEELQIPYSKSAIFAPWWVKLLHLGRSLREYGIPIIGPGARPYKRSSHLIAPLGEELSSYLTEPLPDKIPSIEKELFWLVTRINDYWDFSIFTYHGRIVVYELINAAMLSKEKSQGSGKAWIYELGKALTTTLYKNGLLPRECTNLLIESAIDMIEDMKANNIDVDNLSIEDLGLFSKNSNSIRLLTMHKTKGLEFDAVAIVDLHDGKVPHYSFYRESNTLVKAKIFEEGRRLLYVAITRARRILMYITDREHYRNSPSVFLNESYLDKLSDQIVMQ